MRLIEWFAPRLDCAGHYYHMKVSVAINYCYMIKVLPKERSLMLISRYLLPDLYMRVTFSAICCDQTGSVT